MLGNRKQITKRIEMNVAKSGRKIHRYLITRISSTRRQTRIENMLMNISIKITVYFKI